MINIVYSPFPPLNQPGLLKSLLRKNVAPYLPPRGVGWGKGLETDQEGWIKSHSLLVDESSGKEKDICLAVGGGLTNSCDARILDRLPKGRTGSLRAGLEKAGSLKW